MQFGNPRLLGGLPQLEEADLFDCKARSLVILEIEAAVIRAYLGLDHLRHNLTL